MTGNQQAIELKHFVLIQECLIKRYPTASQAFVLQLSLQGRDNGGFSKHFSQKTPPQIQPLP